MTITKEQLQAVADEVLGPIEAEHLRPVVQPSRYEDALEIRLSFRMASILTVSPDRDLREVKVEFEALRRSLVENIRKLVKQWDGSAQ